MASTVEQAIRVLAFHGKSVGLKETERDLRKVAGAAGDVEVSAQKTARSTSSMDRAFARLEARLDPVIRRERELAKVQATLDAAQRAGLVTSARRAELLALEARGHAAAATAATTHTRALAGLGVAGRAFSGAGFVGGFAGIAAVAGFERLLDTGTRITNALKVAGLQGEALTETYERLYASAQKNAAPLEALVGLFGRASMVQKELGASTEDMLRFTDKVAVSLRVAGRSASESSGALLQLSQALGSGVVRAEELNSILEGALPIAQAAAAGLEEAGSSVAKLRSLVVDGKVSSEAFFRAFLAGSTILDEKVATSTLTLDQGFQRLQSTLINAAGKFDRVTGASEGAGQALMWVADGIDAITAREAELSRTLTTLKAIALLSNPTALTSFAYELAAGTPTPRYDPLSSAGTGAPPKVMQIAPVTVSIDDYAVALDKVAKSADGAGAAIGRIVDIPLPRLRPEVDHIGDALRKLIGPAQSFASTFVAGLRNGESAIDSLRSAVDRLTDSLIDMALQAAINAAFSGIFPGGGAPSASSVPTPRLRSSHLHDGGIVGLDGVDRLVHPAYFDNALRMHSGGIAGLRSDEVPAILQRGETVIPKGAAAAPTVVVTNTVVNNTSAQVRQEERRDSNGNTEIVTMIDDAVAGNIMRSGSKTSRALKAGGWQRPLR